MPTRSLRHLFAVLVSVGAAAPAWGQQHLESVPTTATAAQHAADIDVASVLNGLADPDANVRLAAGRKLLEHAHALAAHADAIAEAVALLDPLDGESDVRRFGRRALLRIGNPALPAVIARLPEDDELLAALAEPGDTASIEPLIGLIAANKALSREADGWSNQTGVKQALLLIGPEKIAGRLVAALEKDRDSLALLVAVSQLAGPEFAEATSLLAEYLSVEDEDRCVIAANALIHIGDASLAELAAALKDRKRRAAAIYSIEQLGPQATSLADRLFGLVKNDSPVTNEVVLAKYGKLAGEVTLGELSERALAETRPPADRFIALKGKTRIRRRLDRGVVDFGGDSLRPDGQTLADLYAQVLSPSTTTDRVERLCREAIADAEGNQDKERRFRLRTIDDERFFRAKTAAAWNGIALHDPRLVEATLRIIDEADYCQYPEQHGDGCGGLEWPDLLFLREAVRNRPDSYLPALRKMLAGDAVDRTKALYLFAHLGPYGREAVEAAFATLDSDLYDARVVAARVLEAHAPPSDQLVAAMVGRILDSEDCKQSDLVGPAFNVLVRHPTHIGSEVPRLVAALSEDGRAPDESGTVLRTCLAANALALAGPVAKTAVPKLRRIAKSEVVEEREAAVLALAAIVPDDESVVPLLIEAYAAAHKRIQKPWVAENSQPEKFVVALGRLETRTQRQIEFLTGTALTRPLIICDPKTAERKLAYTYEAPIAPDAAIAVGRMGTAARDALPTLRAQVALRNSDPLDQSRQLALAIATLRIDGKGNPADVAAVMEILRTTRAEDLRFSAAEELSALGKTYPEIARELRRQFLRTARTLNSDQDRAAYWLDETRTLAFLAPYVQAVAPSDPLCCRRVEDLLDAELRRDKLRYGDAAELMAILETLDDRSERLASILKSAAGHIDPETRWQAAAMLDRIAADPSRSPRVKSTRTSATP